MNRKPTPTILDAVLSADIAPDRAALRGRLRYDYAAVPAVHRKAVEDAAIDILANGQRMKESAVVVGERLLDVKQRLDHGQFSDWCSVEFDMSQRTAQNMMNVARQFGDKSETVSLLSDSALYLLAAPSTPEPAREAVIEQVKATGQSPTKAAVKAIIDQHKLARPAIQPGSPEAKALSKEIKATTWADRRIDPTYPEPPTKSQISGCVDTLAWEAALGSDEKRLAHMSAPENFQYYLDGVRQRLDFPINHYSVKDALAAHIERLRNTLAVVPEPKTITDPVKEITVDGDRPLPAWAAYDDDDADLTAADVQVLKPMPRADDAVIVMTQAEDKIMSLKRLIGVFHHTIAEFNAYGELTGHHVETLPAKRELEKLIKRLERECALLNGQPVEAWGEEMAA